MYPDYYKQLGVRRLINAAGTLTSLGGSRLRPEAAQAMATAADCFVDLAELHQKAGELISRWLHVEAACVTAGAAAALMQSAAACMVGDDPGMSARLPERPARYKIIIQCVHRGPFERNLQLPGAELVQCGDMIHTHPYDLECAIDEATAAVAFFMQGAMLDASLSLDEVITIAHRKGVPVIVDAAAELPPRHHLWSLAQRGADLVIFSGGKDIRGPQSSGLIVGKSKLVHAARFHAAPNEYTPGRVAKASKEQVIGFLAALEAYLAEDEAARFEEWERNCNWLENALSRLPGLRVSRFSPTQPGIQPPIIPRLEIRIAETNKLTVADVVNELRQGDSPVIVHASSQAFWINFHTLEHAEVEIIASRLSEILKG